MRLRLLMRLHQIIIIVIRRLLLLLLLRLVGLRLLLELLEIPFDLFELCHGFGCYKPPLDLRQIIIILIRRLLIGSCGRSCGRSCGLDRPGSTPRPPRIIAIVDVGSRPLPRPLIVIVVVSSSVINRRRRHRPISGITLSLLSSPLLLLGVPGSSH